LAHPPWALEAIIEARALPCRPQSIIFFGPALNFVFSSEASGTIHADKRQQKLCGHYYAIFQRGDISNRSKNGLQNLKRLTISDLARER